MQEANKQLIHQKQKTEAELKKVINDANQESTKFKEELEDVQSEVVNLCQSIRQLKETNGKLERENDELKRENDNIVAKLNNKGEELEKMKKMILSSGVQGKMPGGSQADGMQTELYQSLLDIALNKIKFLEDYKNRTCSEKPKNRVSVSKGQYILRVNNSNPTDMFMESVANRKKKTNDTDVDVHSLSSSSTSDEASMDKRASNASSINMSETFGSDPSLTGLLRSASSNDSVLRDDDDDDVFGGPAISFPQFNANTLPKMRSLSEGGEDDYDSPLPIRPRTSTIGSIAARDREQAYSNIVSPAGFKPRNSLSTPYLTNGKTLLSSFDSSSPAFGGSEDSIGKGDDKNKHTAKDTKKKKADSRSTHFSTLQKLQKYRSVGDLIKGFRRSSKEEIQYHSDEHLHGEKKEKISENNNNTHQGMSPRSKTMDGSILKPKLTKLYRRLSNSKDITPKSEKKVNVSPDSSTGSDTEGVRESSGVSRSASSDNVAGTRTSGFIALRQRRNGFAVENKDFNEISKHIKKKSKHSTDFSSILQKFSRDHKSEEIQPKRRQRFNSKS